jgi:TrkA domain protein
LRIEWYKVEASNDGVNKSIGELGVRQKTGASIIAAIKDSETKINPGPDYVIEPGDTLVIAGKAKHIKLLKELLV